MEQDMFSDPGALLDALKKANALTLKHHGGCVTLERAVFLSWWCSRGDCDFCYLSTQKRRIKDPALARRRLSSILAEVEICRRIGWRVAFLSSGYTNQGIQELRETARMVSHVSGDGVWLNVGVLDGGMLQAFGDEVKGVVASIETLDKDIRKRLCPGKGIGDATGMLEEAETLGLKKGATVILGLGEDEGMANALLDFVRRYRLDRITVYSLNPHRGTSLSNHPPPASLYQAGVIALLRLNFPKLEIVGGTWIDQLPNIGVMLLAGANAVTKYPLFSMFGNRYGRKVEEEVRFAGRQLLGTFTDMDVLAGRKKLPRSLDPRSLPGVKRPEIPEAAVEKVRAMEREIGSKIESYVETVSKRAAKFNPL